MKIFSLVFSFLMANSLLACDICGGGLQMEGANGAIPFYTQNQLILRYSKVDLAHPNTSFNGSSQIFEDQLSQLQLQGRFYLNKNWQLITSLPFAINQRVEEQRISKVNEIGDLNFQVNRFVLNTNDSVRRKTRVLWLLGMGVILPTGKYQQRDETKLMLPIGLQAGQGAYQFSMANRITLRHGSWGFGNYTTFILPQVNELSYQMGNSISNSTLLFHVFSRKQWSLIPQAGFSFFSKSKDIRYEEKVNNTAVSLRQMQFGLDYYFKNYALQVALAFPVVQSTESLQPSQGETISMGVSYFIAK